MSKVAGQGKNTPAMVQELFKKHDVIEFILHEAQLAKEDVVSSVLKFRTPVIIMRGVQPLARGVWSRLFGKTDFPEWHGS